jgi:predicted ester cyclase
VDTLNFGKPAGQAVVARILEDIYRTFPDFRLEIIDLLTKGDLVVVRCKESGTHRGVGQLPVNGGLLVGVAPTEKHFEVEVVHIYTIRNGKIVDHRGVRDDLAMMQQLGLVAEPKPFDWRKFAAEANKH